MIQRWQEFVRGQVTSNPTKWAMLSQAQRERMFTAFTAAYVGGARDGYATGEAATEHAAAVLGVLEPSTLYNWGMGYLKHNGYVTGFKVL